MDFLQEPWSARKTYSAAPAFGRYYLIIKDETRHPPKKHLRLASSNDIAGPYVNLSSPFTRAWVEGPSAIQIGDEFVVYYDAYTTHRYEGKREGFAALGRHHGPTLVSPRRPARHRRRRAHGVCGPFAEEVTL